MDVKEAVAFAKRSVLDLFEEEKPMNMGLEEVELDQNGKQWIVTIGFSRPWDEPRNPLAALNSSHLPRRTYKLVRISADSGKLVSVKAREDRV